MLLLDRESEGVECAVSGGDVDEAGTGMLAKVLGFTTAIGVTLAIVRKARDIFWTAVGVTLIVRRGLSIRSLNKATEAQARSEEVASS